VVYRQPRVSSLVGKIALVTGAASGIGRALAEALAERGALVTLADLHLAGAEAVALRLPGARAVALDVRDSAAFERTVADVFTRHGRLDLFFNNAGVGGPYAEAHELTVDDWRQVLEVNLHGVIHGIAAVYPRMVAQRSGHIVNTASLAGIVPHGMVLPYSTAKHAVVGLSTCLRIEGRAYGVRVSAACPGLIDTNIFTASISYRRHTVEQLRPLMPQPMSAADCARRILAGVASNRAIIPITALTWIGWLAWRWFPGLLLWASEKQLAQIRALPASAPRG